MDYAEKIQNRFILLLVKQIVSVARRLCESGIAPRAPGHIAKRCGGNTIRKDVRCSIGCLVLVLLDTLAWQDERTEVRFSVPISHHLCLRHLVSFAPPGSVGGLGNFLFCFLYASHQTNAPFASSTSPSLAFAIAPQ